MKIAQQTISLSPRPRGFHLITDEVQQKVGKLGDFKLGIAHVFIQHTSASLTLNENASPDVREDMFAHFNQTVPEDAPFYTHTYEGADDMPAHIKSSLLGNSLTIPISQGRLKLGTWQGLYLGEHRNNGGSRRLVITIWGE